MHIKKALPPTYLLSSISLMVFLHYLLPLAEIIPYPWQLSGAVPLCIGIIFNLMADQALKKFNTTVKPFEESDNLVTTGIYGVSRHPMYIGMVLLLLGIAIFFGSLTPFFVIPIFAFLINEKFITVEEQILEKRFGKNWSAYKAKVRRWI
jgi:protein-S-isoprenylcysteine O-methyltransferase Ste14